MAWMMATSPGNVSKSRSRYSAKSTGENGEWFDRHTLSSRVLAEVLGLVSAEKTGGLDLRGGATGELLVEVDDTLHADSIGGGANRLESAALARYPFHGIRGAPSSPSLSGSAGRQAHPVCHRQKPDAHLAAFEQGGG